ncbi:carbohydrate ABC transporter permease [Paenibacillus sp. HB172176]|uniref:carbohydrate ABC transporter permease n=1 Tax=Paenibacillus sp. HB172176 TaxID=2493690 RepID=UPI001F0F2D56|nr:carbohydrate ABC transporter permease [Paenibacillus sp. HB172176]
MRVSANRKTGAGTALFVFLNYAVFTLFTLLCLYPFYYILIYSLSDPIEAQKGLFLWPVGFNLNSYADVFQIKAIYNALFISIVRTISGTCITVLSCSFLAYLLTRPELYLRKTIYRFVVITMFFNAGLIPYYMTIKSIGLMNSFLVYIIPTALSAFYVILIKTYIESLPESMFEAAMLDGAGFLRIYSLIVMPLSKPIIATIAVFSAVGHWNNWFDNYLFVSDPDLRTLQYLLYTYLTQAESIAASVRESGTANMEAMKNAMILSPQTVRMTLTMVVVLPILVVYPFCQKYFTQGIMLGAVKG